MSTWTRQFQSLQTYIFVKTKKLAKARKNIEVKISWNGNIKLKALGFRRMERNFLLYCEFQLLISDLVLFGKLWNFCKIICIPSATPGGRNRTNNCMIPIFKSGLSRLQYKHKIYSNQMTVKSLKSILECFYKSLISKQERWVNLKHSIIKKI